MGNSLRKRSVAGLLSVGAALLVSAPSFAQNEFTGLDSLPGGTHDNWAEATNVDGTVVVGSAETGTGYGAFSWTQSQGMLNIGGLPQATESHAAAVDLYGKSVAGFSYTPAGAEAFLWTETSGVVGLGHLPYVGTDQLRSFAIGISSDGTTVVGISNQRAFRWTIETGMALLETENGHGTLRVARATNWDGSVIVGWGNFYEAFIWREGSGGHFLGDLPGGGVFSTANGVSGTGEVVVGESDGANGREAFLWTDSVGMMGLGDLDGGAYWSFANDVNLLGTVVVGASESFRGLEAFRWLEGAGDGSGMRSVVGLLEEDGVDLGSWILTEALGVSGDGKVIVGYGTNPDGLTEAWRAVVGTGLVGADDFANSMGAMSASGNAADGMFRAWLAQALNAARNYGSGGGNGQGGGAAMIPWSSLRFASNSLDGLSLADSGGSGATSLWTSGAYSTRDGDSIDDSALVGSFGITKQISSLLRFGVGANLGESEVLIKGPEGNDSKRITHGLQAFAAFEPGTSPVRIYLGAVSMRVDDDLVRNYLNGAAPVSSKGNREGSAYGGSVILGLEYPALGNGSIMPFTEYNATRIDLDGYEETTGPFPAEFFTVAKTTQIAKLGVELGKPLSERLGLWGSLARAHRLDDKLPGVSGYIPVLSEGFSFSGTLANQDWTEAKLGLNGQLKDNISIHVSFGAEIEKDEDTSYGGTIGFNIKL